MTDDEQGPGARWHIVGPSYAGQQVVAMKGVLNPRFVVAAVSARTLLDYLNEQANALTAAQSGAERAELETLRGLVAEAVALVKRSGAHRLMDGWRDWLARAAAQTPGEGDGDGIRL